MRGPLRQLNRPSPKRKIAAVAIGSKGAAVDEKFGAVAGEGKKLEHHRIDVSPHGGAGARGIALNDCIEHRLMLVYGKGQAAR